MVQQLRRRSHVRSSIRWGQLLVHHMDQLFHESPIHFKRELPPLLNWPHAERSPCESASTCECFLSLRITEREPFSLSVADVLISNCLWRFVNAKHVTWEMFHGDRRREKCKRFRTRKCSLHIRSSRETVTKQPSHHNLVGKKIQQFMLQDPSGRRHTECDASIFEFDVWQEKKPQRQFANVMLAWLHCFAAWSRSSCHGEALWTQHLGRSTTNGKHDTWAQTGTEPRTHQRARQLNMMWFGLLVSTTQTILRTTDAGIVFGKIRLRTARTTPYNASKSGFKWCWVTSNPTKITSRKNRTVSTRIKRKTTPPSGLWMTSMSGISLTWWISTERVWDATLFQIKRQAPDPRRPLKPWFLLLSGTNSSMLGPSLLSLHAYSALTDMPLAYCCQKTIQSPDRSEWTVEKTLDQNYDSRPSKVPSTMVVLPSRHVIKGHVSSSMSCHVIVSHLNKFPSHMTVLGACWQTENPAFRHPPSVKTRNEIKNDADNMCPCNW